MLDRHGLRTFKDRVDYVEKAPGKGKGGRSMATGSARFSTRPRPASPGSSGSALAIRITPGIPEELEGAIDPAKLTLPGSPRLAGRP